MFDGILMHVYSRILSYLKGYSLLETSKRNATCNNTKGAPTTGYENAVCDCSKQQYALAKYHLNVVDN